MLHRFEVTPPKTTVLISSGDHRENVGPLVDPDIYINARMVGGRNEFGEWQGPCLITIDDDTEGGRLQLGMITERLKSGRLPGVKPYQPPLGFSDDQIEAMVQRRVQEELQRREQPSEEARVLLEEQDVEKAYSEHTTQWVDMGPPTASLAATAVEVVEVEPLKIEVTRAGQYRCPLDRRSFKGRQGFLRHFRMSEDPEHRRLGPKVVEAV